LDLFFDKSTEKLFNSLGKIEKLFKDDDNTKALILIGSFTRQKIEPDYWSDLDLVIVGREGFQEKYANSLDWFSPIGNIFCSDRSSCAAGEILRICMADFQRFDFLFVEKSKLNETEEWNFNPFDGGYRILYSDIPNIDQLLNKIAKIRISIRDNNVKFEEMVTDFWFKGTLAITKTVRNDLLIALHLGLNMVEDCLVLRMMLRDKTEGSRFHRTGTNHDNIKKYVDSLNIGFSSREILTIVRVSGLEFDELASKWDHSYKSHMKTFSKWIDKAEEYLNQDCRESGEG